MTGHRQRSRSVVGMDGSPLARLGTRYVVLSGLRWFPVGVAVPVLVVLLRARDVPIATVGPLLAIYSGIVVLLELPTGGLADRVGRRRVHLAASAVGMVGVALYGVAETTTVFALSMVPQAVSRALLSGPLEAWFVDEARRLDAEADLTPTFARAEAVAALSLGAGALLTALLPQVVDLPESGPGLIAPSLPVLLSVAFEGVHLLSAALLMRPEGGHLDAAEPAPTVRRAVAGAITASRGPVLRRVLVAEFVVCTALVATEQVTPTDLVRLLGERDAATTFAILTSVGFAGVALGSRWSPAWSRRLGRHRAYAAALAVVAAGLLLSTVGTVPALASGYLAAYLALGVRTPVRSAVIHARASSRERASVLSVVSLVFQVGGLLASLALLPLYAATFPAVAFAVPAGLVAVGAVVLARPVPDHRVDDQRHP